jgi:hypothetical protein
LQSWFVYFLHSCSGGIEHHAFSVFSSQANLKRQKRKRNYYCMEFS